jgi:hypothetical protein
MDARQQLLALARAYAAARGISLARVSTLAHNQGGFFARLEDRRGGFTFATFEKCMRWFSANWPEGHDWPTDVPRPLPDVAEAS